MSSASWAAELLHAFTPPTTGASTGSTCGSKGVASRTREGARAFAEAHELPVAYPSLEAMLDDLEINLVELCVPVGLHHELVVQCARAGKHIVVEKPLTGYFGPGDRGWTAEGFSRQ